MSSPRRRSRQPRTSPYFKKKPKSSLPVPPLTSPTFGLIQEELASDPFRLLLATILLNKTAASAAVPVLRRLVSRYPTIESLSTASHADLSQLLHSLGLANKRARTIVSLARAWLANPPRRGLRYRKTDYPFRGAGRDIGLEEEPIADETDDFRVAWEIAHLPGLGPYALDSWRIFCRDDLRFPDQQIPENEEWTTVQPKDKELCAYLTWKWQKVGYAWDAATGMRRQIARTER